MLINNDWSKIIAMDNQDQDTPQTNPMPPNLTSTNPNVAASQNNTQNFAGIALVMSILFAPVGLFMGIVARNKAKAANSELTTANIAIVIALLQILALPVTIVMLVLLNSNGIQ